MDAYLCFVHRPEGGIAGVQVLACEESADLNLKLAELSDQNNSARIEVFRADRFKKILDWTGDQPKLASMACRLNVDAIGKMQP